MPAIELRGVCNSILHKISLLVPDGELLVLLGPTGAGKTTILNAIAGLADYQGSILFDGRAIDDLSPVQRGVGYLFQGLALFPHLTVEENIAYSLRIAKTARAAARKRVDELCDLMHLDHLRARYPKNLSGGEKQRTALARALAASPQALLLDEPLASLDQRFSKYFRMEFRRLQKHLGITTVYVTHDFTEAEEMGDHIAVVCDGAIEQVGRYEDIFFNPCNQIVSRFIGEPTILSCNQVHVLDNGITRALFDDFSLVLPVSRTSIKKIALHPGHVRVYKASPAGGAMNQLMGRIAQIDLRGSAARLKIMVGNTTLLSEMARHICEEMDLRAGEAVYVVIKMDAMKVL